MKTQQELTQEVIPEVLTEALKIELLATINGQWDNYNTPLEMATDIMNSYIFGPADENVHIKLDDILGLIKEVDLEKNPPPPAPEPEPVVFPEQLNNQE